MSLLRLLTAGRSLIGLKRAEVRYHLPVEKALPRFGGKKNPFRATVLPEKSELARESANQVSQSQGALQDQEHAEDGGKGTEAAKLETGGSQTGDKEPDQGQATVRRRGSAVRAFLLWGKAKKAGGGHGKAGRPLVQGELSLDSVKVMRNDLSETDLEVVRAKQPAVAKSAASEAGPAAKGPEAGSGWGSSAGRLLGLSKS